MCDCDGRITVWEDDPNYVKKEEFVPNNPLERPKINYVKPIIAFLVYALQFVGLFFIPYGKTWIKVVVLIAYSLIYFSFIAKRTVIWLVHLYQNKAPDEVRLKCVMEPSCSVYMILAVEKYGVIRGVYKGIRRLFRCGDVSGVDYP
ncbi:MAG: membrane protein insertion efficiency factor YidD [Clostridia bacterium]|jgi:putative component of membrane protein insertase Oxa1/YidC/SpoIIIJ protein YidD|nr:membrane protein insertion efficiency factor YidD [Clostridia bacterium]